MKKIIGLAIGLLIASQAFAISDITTGADVKLDIWQAKINEGVAWNLCDTGTAAASATRMIRITAPTNDSLVANMKIANSGACAFSIYEGQTGLATVDSFVSPKNLNRTFSTMPSAGFTAEVVSIANSPTTLLISGNVANGFADVSPAFVLKKGTKYLITITAGSSGVLTYNTNFFFYKQGSL